MIEFAELFEVSAEQTKDCRGICDRFQVDGAQCVSCGIQFSPSILERFGQAIYTGEFFPLLRRFDRRRYRFFASRNSRSIVAGSSSRVRKSLRARLSSLPPVYRLRLWINA